MDKYSDVAVSVKNEVNKNNVLRMDEQINMILFSYSALGIWNSLIFGEKNLRILFSAIHIVLGNRFEIE